MAANFWTSSHNRSWLVRDAKSVFESHPKDLVPFKTRKNIWNLRLYFVEYIHKLGKRMRLRQRILSTACVFFKRFYLKTNFCEFDPRLVAPTMLFMAAKVEECSYNAINCISVLEQMGKDKEGPKWVYTKDDILECEFYCLNMLGFDLIVFHPYRPLMQYLSDVGMNEVLQTAWEIVNDSYRTDLCLIHPPYLIAIAAIYMACTFQDKNCTDWLNKLNIEMDKVLDITKEMLNLYDSYAKFKPGSEIDTMIATLDSLFQRPRTSSGGGSGSSSFGRYSREPSDGGDCAVSGSGAAGSLSASEDGELLAIAPPVVTSAPLSTSAAAVSGARAAFAAASGLPSFAAAAAAAASTGASSLASSSFGSAGAAGSNSGAGAPSSASWNTTGLSVPGGGAGVRSAGAAASAALAYGFGQAAVETKRALMQQPPQWSSGVPTSFEQQKQQQAPLSLQRTAASGDGASSAAAPASSGSGYRPLVQMKPPFVSGEKLQQIQQQQQAAAAAPRQQPVAPASQLPPQQQRQPLQQQQQAQPAQLGKRKDPPGAAPTMPAATPLAAAPRQQPGQQQQPPMPQYPQQQPQARPPMPQQYPGAGTAAAAAAFQQQQLAAAAAAAHAYQQHQQQQAAAQQHHAAAAWQNYYAQQHHAYTAQQHQAYAAQQHAFAQQQQQQQQRGMPMPPAAGYPFGQQPPPQQQMGGGGDVTEPAAKRLKR